MKTQGSCSAEPSTLRRALRGLSEMRKRMFFFDDDVVNQTIPLILCAEEDVEGNHGATIGKLDEDLVFYLESRGMALAEIYKMMAKARIDAVLRFVPDEKTKADVASYLESEGSNGCK